MTREIGSGPATAHRPPASRPAPLARSEDVARRRRVYTIQMSVRMVCFLSLPFLPGWWKLVALVGALVLPYIAVLMANDPDLDGGPAASRPPAEPEPLQLSAAPPAAAGARVIRLGPDGSIEHVAEPDVDDSRDGGTDAPAAPGGAR